MKKKTIIPFETNYNSKGGGQHSDDSKIDKLNLSLLWDRADIAENQIFPGKVTEFYRYFVYTYFYFVLAYNNWQSESLEELMTVALLEEKVEFVRLFTQNGLIMSDYLNVERLRSLYNDAVL